jgi:hypothetical protein
MIGGILLGVAFGLWSFGIDRLDHAGWRPILIEFLRSFIQLFGLGLGDAADAGIIGGSASSQRDKRADKHGIWREPHDPFQTHVDLFFGLILRANVFMQEKGLHPSQDAAPYL